MNSYLIEWMLCNAYSVKWMLNWFCNLIYYVTQYKFVYQSPILAEVSLQHGRWLQRVAYSTSFSVCGWQLVWADCSPTAVLLLRWNKGWPHWSPFRRGIHRQRLLKTVHSLPWAHHLSLFLFSCRQMLPISVMLSMAQQILRNCKICSP